MLKKLSLPIFLLICILIIFIIIFGFAVVYNYNQCINFDKGNLSDEIYFSAITYLTIGYGDFYPINYIGRVLVAIEGVFSIVSNSLITGMIFIIYIWNMNDLVLPNKIYIKIKDSKQFFCTKVGNKSGEIVDLKVILEIFEYCGDRRVRKFELVKEKQYLEKVVYINFNLDEEIDLCKHLKEVIKTEENNNFRISVRGFDFLTGNLIYRTKNYKVKDIVFIEEFEMFYIWKNGKRRRVKWRDFNKVRFLPTQLIDNFLNESRNYKYLSKE